MKKLLLLLLCFAFGVSGLLAQGTIKGKVIDDSGEAVLYGAVALYKSGALIKGTQTDYDGNYLISNIDAGTYDIEFSYVGLQTKRIEGIGMVGDVTKFIDAELASGITLEDIVVVGYKIPLFDKGEVTSGGAVSSETIAKMGVRSVNQVAATTAGVSVGEDGKVSIRGARGDNTVYYIDGQRVRSGSLPPISEFENIQILTGGVGAQYGDVIGGVISLTSKGPSQNFSGSFDIENSHGLDAFGLLRMNGSISGPILRAKAPEGVTGRTILGYRLNAQYQSNVDDDSPATDIFQVKDDVLERLKANPVLFDNGISTNASQFVTNEDVEVLGYQPNEERERIDFGAKLDAYLGAGIDVTLSGQYFDRTDRFTPGENSATAQNWRVFNSYRNPESDYSGYRGSFRFRQRLGDGQNDSIQGLIRNVTYTLQLGFDRDTYKEQDYEHRDNIFNYGYYGAYDFSYEPAFQTVFGPGGEQGVTRHVDYSTILNGYTPGSAFGINDVLSNYNPSDVGSINDLVMRNGENVEDYTEVWRMHTNVGQIHNTSQQRTRDIYQFDANASFDIVPAKNSDRSHNIQFGILYEERLERRFNIAPRRLWVTMRQLTNGHLGGVDTTNVIDRVLVGADSVDVYANTYSVGATSKFYDEIRKITGDAVNMFTNVEGVDPSLLSLDMFSGRELNDANIVSYYGYDYKGEKLGRGVSFDDFFKTERGRQDFIVGPNNPIYQAAFIQDKFSFEDIIFRVGVRIDRYDANTKVLKDPYSLKNIMTADQFYSESEALRPGGIEDDYKVYVDEDNGNNVKAYRNGDIWYNAEGTQVNDGNVIFGGDIVFPKFTDPETEIQNAAEFSSILDKTFADYEPQVNIMPRLSFSFPISDEANFFAHYDVLVQRPTSNTILTPLDFFYWEFDNRSNDNVRNNSNLKPQKTVDYEVGFQQKLNDVSALKMSVFYKEIRDLIQWRTYLFNPEPLGSYATYDNQDFGTIKGFTFSYDLRRTRNIQVNANYTLQFADGTGSSPETQKGSSELGNLRNIFPLSFDERHRFVLVGDYRYQSGKQYNGPKLWGKDIFANAGLNVQATLVTGRPYTQKLTPRKLSGAGTVGSLNGSRLPSQFTINARIDKEFALGKGEDAMSLNVFFRVSNLLNTKNIVRVYPATGSPDDDGYLASPFGESEINNLGTNSGDPNSFLNAYSWRLVNPNFYSAPRRFYVGAIILF